MSIWTAPSDRDYYEETAQMPREQPKLARILLAERCHAKAWHLADSLRGSEKWDELPKWQLAIRRLENAALHYWGNQHALPLGEPKS